MSTRIKDLSHYKEWYLKSQNEPEIFWSNVAQSFDWHKSWDKVQSGDFHSLDIKWFEGGKLNITENCLDRHLSDKIALIFEPNDPTEKTKTYTYNELFEKVCRFSNVLKEKGITIK